MNTEFIVADLRSKLICLGCDPSKIDQVDCVRCEDGRTIMAFIYFADPAGAEDCEALSFEPPAGFDCAELQMALINGRTAVLH